MRAVIQESYGAPEILQVRELSRPEPKDNEVLIKLHASVVTPSDTAFRKADPFIVRFIFGLTRPKFRVPGGVIAGVVEAVGSGVTRFKTGDRVYGASGADLGAWAEYRCLAEDGPLGLMPEGVSFAEAAGMCSSFLTAMPFLRDEGKIQPGDRVLINGAAGSIGTMAVELAKHAGAHVTGVCSTKNLELVASLGADRVIDRTTTDFTAKGEHYDIIFDTVGKSTFGRCRKALTANGIYLTTVPSFAILFQMLANRWRGGKRAKLATTGLRPDGDKARDLAALAELAETGHVRGVIDRRYPLEEIVAANAYVDTGRKTGNVVIDIMPA